MKGVLADGHDYIQKAQEKGAALAVVDHFTDDDIPQILVKIRESPWQTWHVRFTIIRRRK